MRTLVVLALMAAAIALAAPGNADPNPDPGFLATLDKASITYHSAPEAVAAAHQVCDWINGGQARPDVIKTIASGNPGFSLSDAATFTTLSERAYCPDHPAQPAAQQPQEQWPWWTWISFPWITPGAASY